METYAFWRPPVRTLTFEDFTTMQKQQGKVLGQDLCLVLGSGKVGEARLSIAHAKVWVTPILLEQRQLNTSVNNQSITTCANKLVLETASHLAIQILSS